MNSYGSLSDTELIVLLQQQNHEAFNEIYARHSPKVVYQLSQLLRDFEVNPRLEDAYHELELLGFPLMLSMFDLLKTAYRGDICTNELSRYMGQMVRKVGLYVWEKTVHTKNNKKM